jgi:hypothetical protein
MASIKTANANRMFATRFIVNLLIKTLIYSGIKVSVGKKTAMSFELKCELEI